MNEKLESLSGQHSELSKMINAAGVRIIQPDRARISEFDNQLSEFSKDEILDSMMSRKGDAYTLLLERGDIIKRNFENRHNIAKISLLVAGLDKDKREKLCGSIDDAGFEGSVELSGLAKGKAANLATLLARISIKAGGSEESALRSHKEEKIVHIGGERVWVTTEVSEKLSKNLSMMQELNKKIQLKNAQRQITVFSDDEEKEFESLQQEYLKLLKEQDDLTRDFREEDNMEL